MNHLQEADINIISSYSKIEGKVTFDRTTRVHGTIIGDIDTKPGSKLILMETSIVEGNIHADSITIEGFVRGNVQAQNEIVIAPNGRVFGNVHAPTVQIEAGAVFEGKCFMEDERRPSASNAQLAPA